MTHLMAMRCQRRAQRGLTIVEVLIAMLLLAVLLVPAVNALHTGFVGSSVHLETSEHHYRLLSRMETVLAETFANLEAAAAGSSMPSGYSDPVGSADRILVFIAGYDADDADNDGDPFTGADADILWIRVAIDGSVQAIDSLTTR